MVIHSSNQSMFCLIEDVSTTCRMLCTFVYAKNDGKERRELWKELEAQFLIANGDPWCIMGDLNVTLRIDEHNEGMSCSCADMIEFQECIERIEMEDLNKTGCHFTWTKSLKNPDTTIIPAVMIIPKSLKRKNRAFRFSSYLFDKEEFIPIYGGNLSERVLVLKEELKLIQIKSIENVHDVDLRKEAANKLSEYNEAVNDEVKLLYQLANHGIRHSGDEVPKQFVNHFKNFLGVSRGTESITNDHDLFTQHVRSHEALTLCKDVTMQEIKEALKRIYDNKAPGPGPDGYTAKFFKATWDIVGSDVFEAIKEFFSKWKVVG
ncbi:RNA-directed DNA polymerase, eukaryota, reverse transcriptase zinc-binding domain protein [Tanacetum coccineum]